jgi:hypothetical protein
MVRASRAGVSAGIVGRNVSMMEDNRIRFVTYRKYRIDIGETSKVKSTAINLA